MRMKLLLGMLGFVLFTLLVMSKVFWDSYSCAFEMQFPNSNSVARCEGGIYVTNTRLQKGDETYKINTEALYVRVFDRILLLPMEKDIDVEMKGSLAVYDAEKIRTPQRTFGNQPYSSFTLLRDDQDALIGVAVFSDPNSIFVPVSFIKGSF